MRKFLQVCIALSLTLFLAACDTAEERAEGHFQNALSLVAEGDVERGIVELRNALQLVPNHLEARHELARLFRVENNNPRRAYREYLRIVEQAPDDVLARTELSELAFFAANWEEMRRHGTAVRELAPDDLRVRAISAALDYRAAIETEDNAALQVAVRQAEAAYSPDTPNRILRELLLDSKLRSQEMSSALQFIDDLLVDYPEELRYYRQRLQILIALGDESGVEEQLINMVDLFPSEPESKAMLVRYYLSRGELDKTEAFLREELATATENTAGARVDLIRFLTELRGPDAARSELAIAIAEEENPAPFIMLAAVQDFTAGRTDDAINDLETALEGAEPGDDTNRMRVTLAEMLLATGNDVGARALVERVLADDPSNSGALKMSARWFIESDDTELAIGALRTALDSDPEDAAALTLMADAYTRSGSSNLARDFLALAVEASGNAPAETVRHAQLLISEGRFGPAEDVLLPALRLAPSDLGLLQTAGQLYLEMDDLGRVQQVSETLKRIDTPEANTLAVQLEAQRLNRSSGSEEALQYLEQLAQGADNRVASQMLLLQARISTGEVESAVALAKTIRDEKPGEPGGRMIYATTLSAVGDLEGALAEFTALSNDFPQDPGLRFEIANLQSRNGDPEGARATIDAGLEAAPSDPRLLWAKASYLEQDGDIDAAIEIYEEMYALDSNALVVANNLASLLGTYRDDDESLKRAWTIARRFRDGELPPLQDTYGWITHRRGDSEAALPYLTSAAEGLPEDPIVQYHLAEALFAVGRLEEALDQYRVALDRSGLGDTRPQIERSKEQVAAIEATLANASQASE